jgi:hypothetical protein
MRWSTLRDAPADHDCEICAVDADVASELALLTRRANRMHVDMIAKDHTARAAKPAAGLVVHAAQLPPVANRRTMLVVISSI